MNSKPINLINGKLEKLTITPYSKSEQGKNSELQKLSDIVVQFNPESYSISKSVTWNSEQNASGGKDKSNSKLNAPTIAFGGGGSRQLTLELFFDVTTPIQKGGQLIDDVRVETDKIVDLTRIKKGEAHPRVCLVSWGNAPVSSDFPFIGVITSLTQKFTQFTSDGKPVRANLSVTVLEFLAPEIDKRKTDPELTTRIIKGDETLSSIAADMYGDPKRWRIIAKSNSIDDPRHLEVGRTLTIPKIR